AAAVFLALLGPYLAWTLWYFGGIFPNTLAAKPPHLLSGLVYVGRALLPAAGILLAAGLSLREGGADSPSPRLAFLAVILACGVVAEGGDWMPFDRLLLPALTLLLLAADGVVAGMLAAPRARGAWAPLLVLPLLAGYAAYSGYGTLRERTRYADRDAVEADRVRLVRELERQGVRSVALVDIGLIGYEGRDLRITDLGGLTDPVIAASPGRHLAKRPAPEYLASRSVDLFLLSSLHESRREAGRGRISIRPQFAVEQLATDTDWFRRTYVHQRAVRLGSTYDLHLFYRRGFPPRAPAPAEEV
ncbi:MAG TPA: hypothetical protein VN317_02585, partial [Candidatus Methanoperedens sp.]|nr:hypothetical protein [Candidatus Methanoperedens sp.]